MSKMLSRKSLLLIGLLAVMATSSPTAHASARLVDVSDVDCTDTSPVVLRIPQQLLGNYRVIGFPSSMQVYSPYWQSPLQSTFVPGPTVLPGLVSQGFMSLPGMPGYLPPGAFASGTTIGASLAEAASGAGEMVFSGGQTAMPAAPFVSNLPAAAGAMPAVDAPMEMPSLPSITVPASGLAE